MERSKKQESVGSPSGWDQVVPPEKLTTGNLGAAELQAWQEATARIRKVAEQDGLSRSEVARRADMPVPTFTLWFDGVYTGSYANQTARVVKWLDALDEQRRVAALISHAPGFVATPTADEVIKTLFLAQMLPEMVLVTLGSGVGKTMTAQHYRATRPSTFLVTMRPTTASLSAMLRELALALDVSEHLPERLDRAIGQKLRRNGRHTLLIVDEAQNLDNRAVDQLRHFLDEYGCGIALLGNNELYSRFGKGDPREGFGQIHRRIGKRLVRLQPLPADIEALIAAWNVEDGEIAKLLRAIGRKPGALGQITKTMTLAGILAAGDGKAIELNHVHTAWANRGGDGEAR